MRNNGAGETIRYAITESALGPMLVARTAVGICAVSFADDSASLLGELQRRYPQAQLEQEAESLSEAIGAVQAQLSPKPSGTFPPLDLPHNSLFYLRAWAVMQAIPRGETVTYQQLATKLGVPGGQVAAGAACAANPVAVLVPCHRVLAAGGRLHHYRWGLDRKQALLDLERLGTGSGGDHPHPGQGKLHFGD